MLLAQACIQLVCNMRVRSKLYKVIVTQQHTGVAMALSTLRPDYIRTDPIWVQHALQGRAMPRTPQNVGFLFAGLDGPARALAELKVTG